MRSLFFAITFLLIGTFTFASNNVKEEVFFEVQAIELYAQSHEKQMNTTETKCYREAIDDFGNVYFVRVICPPIIIIED